ncbi:hypothetical protein BDF22DRAFT_697562 [Syncephalis plumigaleata]|nr:hypothetical protein BDF22DRAFT_697562 [Syncephalis plumigaleata]
MTDSQYPGVMGGTHDINSPAHRYQSIPQQDTNEEKMYDGNPNWREDIADAQQMRKLRRHTRYKQVLLSAAAAAVLLSPIAFIHLMRQNSHQHHACQHGSSASLIDLKYGQLDRWLNDVREHSCDIHADTSEAKWLDEGSLKTVGSAVVIPPELEEEGKKKKKHRWVPFKGNGQFYVDPANWHELDFSIKACHSWSFVTVTHDVPKKDDPSEEQLPLDHPDHPVLPEFFKQLEGDGDDGDDDGGDDDKHKDHILVDFKAYVHKRYSQDNIHVVEEQKDGRYSWRLETVGHHGRKFDDGDDDDDHPHPPPPHHPDHPHPHPPPHHPDHPHPHPHPPPHRHHRNIQVVVKLRIRLPESLSSLDAIGLGVRQGAIHVPTLKRVQLGRLKAGAVSGRIHLGNINAVTHIEAGTVHGAVILYHGQAEAIKVGSVSGMVHVTNVSARQLLKVGTSSGETVVHHVEAPNAVVKAGAVSGATTIVDVLAAQFYAGSMSGDVKVYANVSETAHVKSVSGSVRGHINYTPSEGKDPDEYMLNPLGDFAASVILDDLTKEEQEEEEEIEGTTTVQANTVSGSIELYVAHFKGSFKSTTVTGKLEVEGPRVHITSDTPFSKSGYVGEKEDADNGLLVSTRTVTGSASVTFD